MTVSSTQALGQKIGASSGLFGSASTADQDSRVTSHAYTWTAPTCGSVSFRALCGAGGSTDEVWAAAEVSSTEAGGNVCTTTGSSGDTTTPAAASGLELTSGLSMTAAVDSTDVTIEVFSSMNTWIGIGFVEGSSPSMVNADTFICSGGTVAGQCL